MISTLVPYDIQPLKRFDHVPPKQNFPSLKLLVAGLPVNPNSLKQIVLHFIFAVSPVAFGSVSFFCAEDPPNSRFAP